MLYNCALHYSCLVVEIPFEKIKMEYKVVMIMMIVNKSGRVNSVESSLGGTEPSMCRLQKATDLSLVKYSTNIRHPLKKILDRKIINSRNTPVFKEGGKYLFS